MPSKSGDRVRIGIIGAGGFANTHMQFLSQMPDVEVVAFSRRDAAALKEMQARWRVAHGFTDYRALLDMDGLDAVDIVTPTDSHHRITLDAIAAGKHVLCDKPLALTAAQCKEMLDAAEKAKLVHCTNFNQRGRTPAGQIKRYLDEGFVGQVYHCNIMWMQSLQEGARPNTYSWRFKPETGGGPVYELVHVFDMARFLCGEVKRVFSALNTFEGHRAFDDVPQGMDVKVPDWAAHLLEFDSAARGVIHTSWVSRGQDPDRETTARIEVSGRAGRIMNNGRAGIIGYSATLGAPQGLLRELDAGAPYPQPYEQFVRAILTGEPVKTSFFDGYKAAQIVDAAYASSREGKWVEVT
jgi:predicted dehydrogenase